MNMEALMHKLRKEKYINIPSIYHNVFYIQMSYTILKVTLNNVYNLLNSTPSNLYFKEFKPSFSERLFPVISRSRLKIMRK